MGYSKKRALKECLCLWNQIAENLATETTLLGYRSENGIYDINNIKRKAIKDLNVEFMRGYLFYCPCCEFTAHDVSERGCFVCPVWIDAEENGECFKREFKHFEDQPSKKAALEIVYLTEQRLNEFEDKGDDK